VGFELTADGGDGWLDRQAFTVAAAARSEGLFEASFSGPVSAGEVPAAEGPLKLRAPDLRALAEWAGGAALGGAGGDAGERQPRQPPGIEVRGSDRALGGDRAARPDDDAGRCRSRTRWRPADGHRAAELGPD